MDLCLDPNSGVSLYEQIYDYFADKISYGEYKVRDRLPTYTAISTEYGVSISTVKTAYQKLERDGYIKMSNRGSYVHDVTDTTEKLIARRMESVIESAKTHGASRNNIVAAIEIVKEKYCRDCS